MKIGEIGVVKCIECEDDMKRRLLDIGLTTGLKVECVLVSPLGEPKAYWIRGALIALRNEDAKKIIVEVDLN